MTPTTRPPHTYVSDDDRQIATRISSLIGRLQWITREGALVTRGLDFEARALEWVLDVLRESYPEQYDHGLHMYESRQARRRDRE